MESVEQAVQFRTCLIVWAEINKGRPVIYCETFSHRRYNL